MLNIVVSILFKLIRIIGTILLVPLVVILKPILTVFDFGAYVSYIINYIELSLTYVSFFLAILHIPLAPLLTIVAIGGTLLTLTISVRGFLMVKSIWGAIKGYEKPTKPT